MVDQSIRVGLCSTVLAELDRHASSWEKHSPSIACLLDLGSDRHMFPIPARPAYGEPAHIITGKGRLCGSSEGARMVPVPVTTNPSIDPTPESGSMLCV